MSLFDLPEEMLEHIADQLDSFSLIALALSNPRLQRAALTRGLPFVRIGKIQTVINRMLPVGDYVQYMDLSNHYQKSSALEGVILGCPELRGLNVVNANLTFDQLMNILDNLGKLDVVSCTLFRLPSDACHERRVLKAQRSIKRLYIDFNPSITSMLFLARFLNRCSVIEYLHLNFIGLYDKMDDKMPNPFPEKAPRWRTLHTMVGTFHLTSIYTLRDSLRMFYDFSRPRSRQVFTRQDMKLVPHFWWWINDFTTPEVVVTNNVDALRPLYHIEPQVVCPPSMLPTLRWPEYLVELDLTFITWANPEPQWKDLIQNTPNLRILAFHICHLPSGPDFDTIDPNGTSQVSYLIHELAKLKLHKLHIMVGEQKFAYRDCDRCVAISKCYVLGNFERLRYLDELTLTGVFPSPLLFESLANSSMRILRLCLKRAPRMAGFAEMLMFCKSLKYFKFEAPDLPLHSRAFWDALKSGNAFDQICIASDSCEEVDSKMVREFLPGIMRKIDVFHLHADQHFALYREISDYIADLKKNEPHRDIKLFGRGYLSLSGMRKDALVVTMPGRNLCCASLLIGKIHLDGWTLF